MRRQRKRLRPNRDAIATAELAVCLPLILTICIATIDLCSAMFLRESLTIAAYEGARVGVPKGGTNATATARITALLDERNIQYDAGSVVTFSGNGFDGAQTLDHVRVTVSVPAATNLISPAKFFGNKQISAAVTMRKEYANFENN